jgi:GT2 family glycosyltransferase
MERSKFSIVSLNYNGRKILGPLLDAHLSSLLNTAYDDFEIVFVDNGSSDDSVDYVRTNFSNERLKIVPLEKNYGYAKGNNLALKFVNPSTDIVVFINNDTIVTKDWLTYLADAFNDPEIGIAQPLILDINTGLIQFLGGFTDQWGRTMTIGSGNDDKVDRLLRKIIEYFQYRPLQVLWAYGACIAIRKRLLDRIGGFNELFRFSHEEQSLCIPANALGYKVVVVPKAVIYHRSGATISKVKPDYELLVNRFLYILFYYPFPMLVKSLLGRLILEVHSSSLHNVLKALLEALKISSSSLSKIRGIYKISYDFLISSPINLTSDIHIELTLKKLIEVNKVYAHSNWRKDVRISFSNYISKSIIVD